MRLPLAAAAATATLLVVGAVGWRPAMYATGLLSDGGSPTVSPTFFDSSSVAASTRGGLSSASSSVGGAIGSASPRPSSTPLDKATLAKALAAVPGKGVGTTSGMVLDAGTGEVLWQSRPTLAQIPASTMKLFTCLAALDALGPEQRFTTSVVQPAPGSIVLVGGGDPYLASKPAKTYPATATSAQLAKQTAAALKQAGQTTVTLGHDESLFSGPTWHPAWPPGYHDQVNTLGALWIDKGRPDEKSPPSKTPAATAATLFAAQLKANGITVKGRIAPATPGAEATQLAAVQSLPVSVLVQETLVHSDNAAAETLLRHVGVATGHGGSFAGGVKGVQERLTALGVPMAGVKLSDGSGLSRENRVTAAALAKALHLAVGNPRLAPLLEGLPVAGVTGTLHTRFEGPAAAPGRGWVNAKTGNLSKVSTLAGHTHTRNGRPVVFALMANDPTEEWGVRNWLDQMSATVATCDC